MAQLDQDALGKLGKGAEKCPANLSGELWRVHCQSLDLHFEAKRCRPEEATHWAAMKRVLFMSLTQEQRARTADLTPTGRPGLETYDQYKEILSRAFVPPAESEVVRQQYMQTRQRSNEPIQTYNARITNLWRGAFNITPATHDLLWPSFLTHYIGTVVHQGVKLDLLEKKDTINNSAALLTVCMASVAKHRAMLHPATPADSKLWGGIQATAMSDVSASSGGREWTLTAGGSVPGTVSMRTANLAAPEPMDLSALYESSSMDEETEETMLGALQEIEEWEGGQQSIIAALQDGRQERLCYSCQKPGHLKRDCWKRPRNARLAQLRGSGGWRGGRGRGGRGGGGWRGRGQGPQQATIDAARGGGWRGAPAPTVTTGWPAMPAPNPGYSSGNSSNYLNAIYEASQASDPALATGYEGHLAGLSSTGQDMTPPAANQSVVSNQANLFGGNF